MDTLIKRMKKATLDPKKRWDRPGRPHYKHKRETYFQSERVPKELVYTDFVYPEDLIPNSEVAFDAAKSAKRFDALEPLDPELWNEEVMRREEWWLKHLASSRWKPKPQGRRAERLHRALVRTAPSNKPDWDWG